MPRQLRIEYVGAVYQVMARGNRREDIVLDDEDREKFLSTLGDACGRIGSISLMGRAPYIWRSQSGGGTVGKGSCGFPFATIEFFG